MENLIEALQSFRSELNGLIIDCLVEDIKEEGLCSLCELKEVEDKTDAEIIIKNYLKEIDDNPFEFEGKSYDEIQTLKRERKMIGNGKSQVEKKHFIIYCQLTNRINPLPYTTYQMILDGTF